MGILLRPGFPASCASSILGNDGYYGDLAFTKHLNTMSRSTAILLGSQFWKAHNGGLFLAWFLPILLLVIFRPNLENRVALKALDTDWFIRRRKQRHAIDTT